jgi:hypothetical protein
MRLAMKALALTITASCSSSPDLQLGELGAMQYTVPFDWRLAKSFDRPSKSVEWRPVDNNEAKQSVTILLPTPLPAMASAAPGTIERLLSEAQASLPAQVAFDAPTRFTTKQGLVGVRLEGNFVPNGKTETYHRIHAVVIDGDALVHVLATGVEIDRQAFDDVVDSLHRKGV